MLEAIPNFPQSFMDKHMAWHAQGGVGGRIIVKGQPGSGAEFLDFHHQYIVDVKAWYAGQLGSMMSKLDPWLHFPADLVAAHPALTNFENTAASGTTFSSEDTLGIYIESTHDSVHGWIAALYAQPEFGSLDSCMYFMFYQWHGMVDLWRGHWLASHKSAVKDVVDHPKFRIKDVIDVNPKILHEVPRKLVLEVPLKSPKESIENPGSFNPGDPIFEIADRVSQLENLVHQTNMQAFIRKEQRPQVK